MDERGRSLDGVDDLSGGGCGSDIGSCGLNVGSCGLNIGGGRLLNVGGGGLLNVDGRLGIGGVAIGVDLGGGT